MHAVQMHVRVGATFTRINVCTHPIPRLFVLARILAS